MRFKIRDEYKKELEPEIELWLKEERDMVKLWGKDKEGREKILMRFKDGKFYRVSFAELEGLETDEVGRIIEKVVS